MLGCGQMGSSDGFVRTVAEADGATDRSDNEGKVVLPLVTLHFTFDFVFFFVLFLNLEGTFDFVHVFLR